MALCPFAKLKVIPPGSNDPSINARAAILHVAVSLAGSLFEYFRDRSGGIESHFYVTLTGDIEQYRDTGFQADANLDANDFAVSIETAGLGGGKWNARQLRALKRLLLWLHEREGIPLDKILTWDGAGVGYHTQFGAPSHWTPVAKSCPGPKRIRQYHNELLPWMKDPVIEKTPAELRAIEARQQRALQRVRARTESTNRVVRGRAWIRLAALNTEKEERRERLLDWLEEGQRR